MASDMAQPSPREMNRAILTIEGSVSATDNGALSAPGQERRDVIASMRPRLVLGRRGAGLEYQLDAAATLLGYANGTQSGGVLPDVHGSLKATVVERLFFVDAAARVFRSQVDPFGARADDTTGANRRTESNYRISPFLQRELSSTTSILARHDVTVTTNAAGEGSRLLTQQSILRVERQPVPLGASAELSRLRSESSGSAESRFTLSTARARATVALGGDVVLGASAGAERSEFLLSQHNDAFYGVSVQWRPGPRTDLAANVEHRFFGVGGEFSFRHRMPSMSVSVTARRLPTMSTSSLGVLAQGADIRSFLAAILTTRYPDPSVRGNLVEGIVSSRGLQSRLPDAIDIVSQYPQLQSSVDATWVFLGRRNTASLKVYALTARQLTRDGDPLAPVVANSDSRQTGSSFQFNHRLTQELSADLVVERSRIAGLGARTGEVSDQRSERVSATQQLSPRTGASVGVQRTRFTTTAAGQHSYDATVFFIGMNHRF
jgi:uncharacterized protein (PEP-CTERM system associated)